MSLFHGIAAADSPSIDSFGRWRVSNPETLFDSKQLYSNQALFWDDAETTGSGTSSSHSSNEAATTISVSASTTGTRVRQTFRRFNYQSGKSHLLMFTFSEFNTAVGITKRVGYFDDNNGIFFESAEGTVNIVNRSYATGSAVNTTVSQSSWNIDTLDGSGMSGETLDFSKAQIGIIDLQWLGVGRVRLGFVIDGIIYYCHEFLNANVLSTVYMSTPNLPLRYEIYNDGNGAADDFVHICSTVITEGGSAQATNHRYISRATTSFSTQSDTDIYPLLSIRLKSGHEGANIIPELFNIICTSTSDYEALLILNPTVAGTDNASWTSLSNSCIEYDISRDNTNKLTGGTVLFGDYSPSGDKKISRKVKDELATKSSLLIGADITGNRDELVLAVRNLSAGVEDYYAGLNIGELV